MILPPPSDVPVERAYLGNILTLGNRAISKGVGPEDFYKPAHAEIYKAILKVNNSGNEVDANIIARMNKEHFSVIFELVDCATSKALNPSYAKIISESAKKRKGIALALELVQELRGDTPFQKTADKYLAGLSGLSFSDDNISHGLDSDDLLTVDDCMVIYQEHVRMLKEGGVKTGIEIIDQNIRNISKGEVMTIIARPGCFKTALLQNALVRFNQAHPNEIALFFSLEMPAAGVFERFSQRVLGLPGAEVETRWRNDTLGVDNVKKVREALSRIIVVETSSSIGRMRQLCKMAEKKTGKKVGLVGIDYLGLVEDAGKNEYERNSNVATNVKKFAKAQKVPTILLSQLNRTGGDGTTPVTLDMARGSGQIEEAADFIIGLWQGGDMKFGLQPLGCSLLKNRKGPKGITIPVGVNPVTMKFHDPE